VNSFPLDESVYGIRDLAGSADEPTTGVTIPHQRFASRRGGNWWTADAYRFEIATRLGRHPEKSAIDCGFRVVVELSEN
jgi:formylglycine-generating enzyme required for sulfatase activity